jgi:V8-like Glu-specific endopeptidase
MNCKSRVIIITVVVMAVLALTFSVQAGSLTVVKKSSSAEEAATMHYWTRDRIADAPALSMPVDMGDGEIDTSALDEVEPLGLADSAAPGMAAPVADRIARLTYSRDWSTLYGQQALEEMLKMDELADDEQDGTQSTYTYFDVNTNTNFWTVYPHKWVGKLTFLTPSGSASCSATAISNNHIVTAAHCVYNTTTNKWYSNFVFTPAYRNGSAPYGVFPYASARILTAYTNLTGSFSINSWTRYDVAVLGVKNNSAGKSLNYMVGWAGRMWNYGYNQLNFNSGYPGIWLTTGGALSSPNQYLRACVNESFQQTTDTLGGGCNYGSGNSGGSWLVGYKPFVAAGSVASVVSGHFTGQPNSYGARFTGNNIVVLCTADGC